MTNEPKQEEKEIVGRVEQTGDSGGCFHKNTVKSKTGRIFCLHCREELTER